MVARMTPRAPSGKAVSPCCAVALTAAAVVVFLIAGGLASDLARLQAARNELQIVVDEAAIAAAFELDATAAGRERARAAASIAPVEGPNHWHSDPSPSTSIVTLFAEDPAGPWEQYPGATKGSRYLRVETSRTEALYVIGLLPRFHRGQTVRVSAVAGQCRADAASEGPSSRSSALRRISRRPGNNAGYPAHGAPATL